MGDILEESRLRTIQGSEFLGSLNFLFKALRRCKRGAQVLHHNAMKPSEIRIVLSNKKWRVSFSLWQAVTTKPGQEESTSTGGDVPVFGCSAPTL